MHFTYMGSCTKMLMLPTLYVTGKHDRAPNFVKQNVLSFTYFPWLCGHIEDKTEAVSSNFLRFDINKRTATESDGRSHL